MQIGPNQGRKIRSFYKGRYQPGSGFKASAAHLNPKFPWNASPIPLPLPPPPHITHIMARKNGRAGDTSLHCKIRRLVLQMCVDYFGCVSFFNWEDPRLVSWSQVLSFRSTNIGVNRQERDGSLIFSNLDRPPSQGKHRSLRLEVVGTGKNGCARRRHVPSPLVCLPRARPFSLIFRPLLPSACYAG